MRIIFALILLSLLTGCAVLDVASLEKAIPLAPKKVEVSLVRSEGLDLDSAVLSPDELDENGNTPVDYKPDTGAVTGFQAALGLQNDMEIGTRFYTASDNYGLKLFLKKLLNQSGKNYVAIEPALTYLATFTGKTDQKHDYSAFGGELQLLYTHEASDLFAFTLIARTNVNRYEETHWNDNGVQTSHGTYTLAHGGIRGNVELRYRQFFFMPELGLEIVPVVNGPTGVALIYGIALGAEF